MQTGILTFYRFIAASVVVIFHFGQGTFLSHLAPGFFSAGPEMVTFFFVLSGFVMALTCFDQTHFSARHYWLNRFSKIYPVYLIAAVIMMVLFGNRDGANDTTAILLHITMLQSWFPAYPLTVNVPAWSLSIEAFFYAIFPVILYIIKNGRPTAKSFLLFAISFWLLTQIIHLYLLNNIRFSDQQDIVKFFVCYFPLSHLCSFILGMAGYYFLKQRLLDNAKGGLPFCDVLLAASLLGIFLVLSYKPEISTGLALNLPFQSSLLSPLFLLLILASSGCENIFTRGFSQPLFIQLGEASYAIYILQKPVRSLYLMYIYPLINTTWHIHLATDIHFLMYFFLLLLVSIWITAYVEKPVKELLRKTFS